MRGSERQHGEHKGTASHLSRGSDLLGKECRFVGPLVRTSPPRCTPPRPTNPMRFTKIDRMGKIPLGRFRKVAVIGICGEPHQMMQSPEEADPEFPPVVSRYRPALQLMQDAWPAVAWTRPAALQGQRRSQHQLACTFMAWSAVQKSGRSSTHQMMHCPEFASPLVAPPLGPYLPSQEVRRIRSWTASADRAAKFTAETLRGC